MSSAGSQMTPTKLSIATLTAAVARQCGVPRPGAG